ncbi:MAG: hypothetical protein ACAH59_09210 [Pseudobdellovibrionaceae bacterium]
MDFFQRSYSGHSFRPRPLIEEDKSTNTLIVATSWGGSEHAQLVVDTIKEQLIVSEDTQATRINSGHQGLSEEANLLRQAATLANERLYLRENNREYSAAVEIALITVQKETLHWAQLGTPHLLLSGNQGFQPLCYSPDWSWQLQQSSPLVSKALGLDRQCYLNCGSYKLQGNEKLLMICRSAVPGTLYQIQSPDLTTCSQALVEDNSNAPFWLGVVGFS